MEEELCAYNFHRATMVVSVAAMAELVLVDRPMRRVARTEFPKFCHDLSPCQN
jgi:5-enolpyruvylshikimate-3-phosphate synthase